MNRMNQESQTTPENIFNIPDLNRSGDEKRSIGVGAAVGMAIGGVVLCGLGFVAGIQVGGSNNSGSQAGGPPGMSQSQGGPGGSRQQTNTGSIGNSPTQSQSGQTGQSLTQQSPPLGQQNNTVNTPPSNTTQSGSASQTTPQPATRQ